MRNPLLRLLKTQENGVQKDFQDNKPLKTESLNIRVSPKTFFFGLLATVAFLLLANLIVMGLELFFEYEDAYGLARLFDFSAEKNIPTLFSSLALFLCATLLTVIGVFHKRLGSAHLSWFGLGAVFLFLSVDETASLHEKLTVPMREVFGASGLFHFTWIIPYGTALLVLGMLYFRFLGSLPRQTLALFAISGAVYISGAIGLEMLGGLQVDLYGNENLAYSLIVAAEELLEMLGLVIFIYALLFYIAQQFENATITIASAPIGLDLGQDRDLDPELGIARPQGNTHLS